MTKRKKLQILKKMLKLISSDRHWGYGLCEVLERVDYDVWVRGVSLEDLGIRKPRKTGLYWWRMGDAIPRKRALRSAIKRLEKL